MYLRAVAAPTFPPIPFTNSRRISWPITATGAIITSLKQIKNILSWSPGARRRTRARQISFPTCFYSDFLSSNSDMWTVML